MMNQGSPSLRSKLYSAVILGMALLEMFGSFTSVAKAETALPLANTICQGTTINGVAGTAVCAGTSVTVSNSSTASGVSGQTVTFSAAANGLISVFSVDFGSSYLASNICSTATIFGLSGLAGCAVSGVSTLVQDSTSQKIALQSTVSRAYGTTLISGGSEVSSYNGQFLPSGYHEVPQINLDDDGYCNADAVSLGVACATQTTVTPITYAQHVAMTNCGNTQSTVAARVADCLSKNPTSATWVGSTNGINGEATWSLVTRLSPDTSGGACALGAGAAGLNCVMKEVWLDQRTNYLWSSLVAGAANKAGTARGTGPTAKNWCQAVGTTENANGLNCTAGGVYQPATPVSFCSEVLSPGIPAENWVANTPGTYTYDNAKGGMGRYSSPGVMWRLPNIYDIMQADIDGIRFVLPDSGTLTGNGNESQATTLSSTRTNLIRVNANRFSNGYTSARSTAFPFRCVGRF